MEKITIDEAINQLNHMIKTGKVMARARPPLRPCVRAAADI
jgi:hypothetical protein